MMLVSLFEETRRAHAIAIVGSEGCASQRRVAKATELNRHTTRMKMRGSVVSPSFFFFFSPYQPEYKSIYLYIPILCTKNPFLRGTKYCHGISDSFAF